MQGIQYQLFDYGMMAFSQKDYKTAINYFSTLLVTAEDWGARWHLAMSYQNANMRPEASYQYIFIAQRCPLRYLREHAQRSFEDLIVADAAVTKTHVPGWFQVRQFQSAQTNAILQLQGTVCVKKRA